MSKAPKIILILILPLVLFFLSRFYFDAYTPYYLNGHFDPNYVYLLNSLNLAQLDGYGVGHVDHPGTPLQVIGAFVVKCHYTLFGINDNIVTDVFEKSEEYLRDINLTLVTINSLILFFFGLVLYKIFRNVTQVLFLQLTPLFTPNIFCKLAEVTPENFLIGVVILLLMISFKYVFSKDENPKRVLTYIILFALVIGFGVALKLNFIAMIFIPLFVLKNSRSKIIFSTLTVAAFVIFVIPAIQNYVYFFEWIKELIIHSGIYGGGDANVVKSSDYISNLKNIFLTEKLFAYIYLVSLICIVAVLILKRKRKINLNSAAFNFLCGIFCSMTFEMIITAKHFVMRYMLPSLMLSVTAIFLVTNILSNIYEIKFKKVKQQYIFSSLIIILIALNIRKYKITYDIMIETKAPAYATERFIANTFNGELLVTGHASYNKNIALFRATPWSGSRNLHYKKVLAEMFPDQLVYADVTNQIYDLSKSTDIGKVIKSKSDFIFLGNKINSVDSLAGKLKQDYGFDSVTYDKIYEGGNGENVFEVRYK